jgi:hypothetical protein
LYPISVEKATSKLPKELDMAVEAGTAVQKELLKTLNEMRFNPPPTKHAQRPKKNQKLPAGASYTCPVASENHSEEEEEEEESSDSDSDTDSDERSRVVQNIVARLGKRRHLDDDDEEEEEEEEENADDLLQGEDQGGDREDEDQEGGDQGRDQQGEDQSPPAVDQHYPAKSFIVAVYQGDWYVGQVMDKEGEPEAEESDCYLLVSFMEKMKGDQFKWPNRSDILNVLKDDVLFSCAPPIPGPSTSSSRFNSYLLSKKDLAKANKMFTKNQAYYPTKMTLILPEHACVGVCVCVYDICIAVISVIVSVMQVAGSNKQSNYRVQCQCTSTVH